MTRGVSLAEWVSGKLPAARCEPYAVPPWRRRQEAGPAKAARSRARKAALVATGAYEAPPGVRFELEAWALVLREEWVGGVLVLRQEFPAGESG